MCSLPDRGPVLGGGVVKVTFDIPDQVWARLATVADDRGVKVRDILAGLITLEVRERPVESVIRLHRAGKSTPEIARALGMTNSAVSGRLRRNGLKSNTRRTA